MRHAKISLHSQSVVSLLAGRKNLAEAFIVVAPLAVPAELTEMHVVFFMTRPTSSRQADSVSYRCLVTGCTLQTFMGAQQRKIGLQIMIEFPKVPRIWRMTTRASRPEATLVIIVITVAVGAFTGCILECRRQMTLLTRDGSVEAN